MTYLEIVNKVLVRLREEQVTSVSENEYSSLISDLTNVTKNEIENAWNWKALRNTFTITTVEDIFNWRLEGSGTRFRVLDAYNATTKAWMYLRPTEWMDKSFAFTDVLTKGAPQYYAFNGVDSNEDTQVDIFPVPDKEYIIRINAVVPQADLVLSADVPLIPAQLIIEGTIARAISERGEDGGMQDQEFRYQRLLSDYISIEAAQKPYETIWQAV
jgi:hypothetical protein|tara:strand:- start:1479 stop:2123 length:645 start_codon:yes stop_codon:yes gene_type:complete